MAVASILMGVLLRLSKRLPAEADRTVAGLVIQFSAPPVAFLAARGMPFSTEMLLPASMAWIMFGAGLCFFWLAGRLLKLPRETFACLMLTGAMSNVLFIGLPMIEAFFGRDLLYVAFLCDGPGSSLVLALPCVILASWFSPLSARRDGVWPQVKNSLKRVALFPPLQGMLLGLLLRPVALPDWLLSGLKLMGATLVPLSLVAVGLGLRLKRPGGQLAPLALGLSYKLVLAPALMLAVAAFFFGNTGPVAQVTVFEAAMPPMILGGILAAEYGLDAELAALMIGLGTPLSFLSLPAWHWVLARL